mgnify:CR=1 FL=1
MREYTLPEWVALSEGVLLDSREGVMYELNEEAEAVLSTIDGSWRTVREIMNELRSDWEFGDEEAAEREISEFLESLVEEGLVVARG